MSAAAIYARYSSDLLREASIEDQNRICRERAAKEGWSCLALDAPNLPSRGGEPMEKCGYRSVIACSARRYFCSIDVNLTTPFRVVL